MSDTLPPLTEPHGVLGAVVFSADQMREHAAAAVATEREKIAAWMSRHSYSTGHGDTVDDLLRELEWQINAPQPERTSTHAENESLRAGAFKPQPLFASGEHGVLLSATEPVAWGWRSSDGVIRDCIGPDEHDRNEGDYTVPLYTAPPHIDDALEAAARQALEALELYHGTALDTCASRAITALREALEGKTP